MSIIGDKYEDYTKPLKNDNDNNDKIEQLKEEDLKSAEETDYLLSSSIDDLISDKKVKTTKMEQTDEIKRPCYIVDMTKVEEVTGSFMNGLSILIQDDAKLVETNKKRENKGQEALVGNTYVYIKTAESMVLAGKIDAYIGYKVLEGYIKNTFGDNVRILKDSPKGFREVKEYSVETLRLNI